MIKIDNDFVSEIFYCKKNLFFTILYYFFSILTLGIVYLSFEWFTHLKLYLYTKMENPEESDFVGIRTKKKNYIFLKLKKELAKTIPNEDKKEILFFKFENQKYYLNKEKNIYEKITKIFSNYLKQDLKRLSYLKNGLKKNQIADLKKFYGENIINIKIKNILYYFFLEFKTPLIILQLFEIIIFYYTDYIYFAIALLIMMFYSMAFLAFKRRLAQRKIKDQTFLNKKVIVQRVIENTIIPHTINSSELVIGDIVLVDTRDKIISDMILLTGNCSVNEANLTGEVKLVQKIGVLDNLGVNKEIKKINDIEFKKRFSFNENNDFDIGEENQKITINTIKNNKLYAGTYCKLVRNKALGLVVKTGWHSSRGDFVVNINHHHYSNFRFNSDLKKILFFLIFFTFVFTACFYFHIRNLKYYTFSYLVEIFFEVLTTIIHPALFFGLTVGFEYANDNLAEKKIYSTVIEKSNDCARIKYMCFDKTGTLTTTRMSVSGYLLEKDFENSSNIHKFENIKNDEELKKLYEILSCCNSLIIFENRIQGDPLEEELFHATDFMIEINNEKSLNFHIEPSIKFKEIFNLESDFYYKISRTCNFSSKKRFMSCIIENNFDKEKIVISKGSAMAIQKICKEESLNENFKNVLKKYSLKGYRILALAYKRLDENVDISQLSEKEIECDLNFLGIVFFENPLKANTKKVIKILKDIKIENIMVTGDNIHTALNVSLSSGIISKASSVFIIELSEKKKLKFNFYSDDQLSKKKINNNSSEFDSLDYVNLKSIDTSKNYSIITVTEYCKSNPNCKIAIEAKVFDLIIKNHSENPDLIFNFIKNCVIYARADPDQKSTIVKYYKKMLKQKQTDLCVGFIGDGANDGKALKMANVGLSIGINESSIAAPFTTEINNIEPVLDLLKEGKNNLEISLQNFKFVMVSSFAQFCAMIFLISHNLDFTNADYYFTDIFTIIPIAVLLCKTKANEKLNKYLPLASLINPQIILSLILNFLTIFVFLSLLMYILMHDVIYKNPNEVLNLDKKIIMGSHFFSENKYLIIGVNFLIIAYGFAVNRGFPFRKSVFTNYSLIGYSIFLVVLHIFLLFGGETKFIYFDYFFIELARQPHYNRRMAKKFLMYYFYLVFTVFIVEKIIDYYFMLKNNERTDKYEKDQDSEEDIITKSESDF